MEKTIPNWTLAELAETLRGQAEGPADLRLSRPVPAGSNDPEGVTFAESMKYLDRVAGTGVGAVIVWPDAPTLATPIIRVEHPRAAFGMLLHLSDRKVPLNPGIHPTAAVDPAAQVAPSAQIGAYAVVEQGAKIGERARIYAFCYVGENCVIGDDVTLYPHAVLLKNVRIGAGAAVHCGAVLGSDGFGFAWDGVKQQKIPQVGGVNLGAEVEVGANTCIDRATCGETVIGDDTKIDNLVQIAHNCQIGSHTVIAGLTGIAGSVTIGDRVVMGGHSALKDHVSVGSDISLAGRTGVMRDLVEPGEYFGIPATPAREALRLLSLQQRLPEIVERIKVLEQELARLRKEE